MRPVTIAAALTASNFLYQAMGAQDWWTALDRSFFEAVGVGLTAVMLNFRGQS